MPLFFSIYLDFLRIAGTVAVYLSHESFSLWSANIAQNAYFNMDVILFFFVLSGFVISYAAEEIEKKASVYIINRIARILPVAYLSIFLSLIFAFVMASKAPALYPHRDELSSIPLYLGMSLSFLNQVWFHNISPFDNMCFWSLAYEVWIYIAFGILLFLRGWRRTVCLLAILAIFGPNFLLMAYTWYVGRLAYLFGKRVKLEPPVAIIVSVLPVAIYFYSISDNPYPVIYVFLLEVLRSIPGSNHVLGSGTLIIWYSYVASLLAIHFFGVRQVSSLKFLESQRLTKVMHTLAGYTFTCYLLHYPIGLFIKALLKSVPEYSIIYNISLHGGEVISLYLLALISERKRVPLRNYLYQRFSVTPLKPSDSRGLTLKSPQDPMLINKV